jgi:hypothetical protein
VTVEKFNIVIFQCPQCDLPKGANCDATHSSRGISGCVFWGMSKRSVMMCDYSLHNVRSRPAKVGDQLVTTDFPYSATGGFCAVGEPGVAVCLLPGTEIAFEKEAKQQMSLFRVFRKRRLAKLSGKLARFRRINLHNAEMHHDALEFAEGATVLLTRLRPGQRATVLQLPAQGAPSKETVELQHLASAS